MWIVIVVVMVIGPSSQLNEASKNEDNAVNGSFVIQWNKILENVLVTKGAVLWVNMMQWRILKNFRLVINILTQ